MFSLTEGLHDNVIISYYRVGKFAKKLLNLNDPEVLELFSSKEIFTQKLRTDYPTELEILSRAINEAKINTTVMSQSEW